MKFDYLIVGAGLSGITFGLLAASKGKKVIIVDGRHHLGGNCYDELFDGFLVHRYGPHFFRTNDDEVFNFVKNFTDIIPYFHKAKAFVDSKYVPVPPNIDTIKTLFPGEIYNKFIIKLKNNFKYSAEIPLGKLLNLQDNFLKDIAEYIKEKIYKPYSEKQWKLPFEDLDSSHYIRVPFVFSTNDQYYRNVKYQFVPKDGYTKMFYNMLHSQSIPILLNYEFKHDNYKDIDFDTLVYTGTLDKFFDYEDGYLDGIVLDFEINHYSRSAITLPESTVINYPSNFDYTRITFWNNVYPNFDKKDILLTKEYPYRFEPNKFNFPFYYQSNNKNMSLYKNYTRKMRTIIKRPVLFLGRLGKMKYLSMDEAISDSLSLAKEVLWYEKFAKIGNYYSTVLSD